jgi:hypothetical protein
MPIPAHVLELIGAPLWGHAGTRDAELVSHDHLTWGIRATANRAELEVLLPNAASMTGLSGVFKLRASEIYAVEEVEKVTVG